MITLPSHRPPALRTPLCRRPAVIPARRTGPGIRAKTLHAATLTLPADQLERREEREKEDEGPVGELESPNSPADNTSPPISILIMSGIETEEAVV